MAISKNGVSRHSEQAGRCVSPPGNVYGVTTRFDLPGRPQR